MAEGELVRFESDGGIGIITVDNPPVNALSPGVPQGIVEALDKGNADPAVKAMVLIGAGRSFIAGADIRQFGKPAAAGAGQPPRMTTSMPEPEAGGRGDPRLCAGRRARDRARLPLPRRGAERQGRPARSADRHPPRRRRHPAPAAPDRPQGGAGDDHLAAATSRPRRRTSSASSTRWSPEGGNLRQAAIAFARKVADTKPLPLIRDHDEKLAEAQADPACSTRCANRSPAAPATSARPMPASRRSRPPASCRLTRASRSNANCSTSWKIRTRRGRCVTPFSPSARWRRCPTSRATRRCARPRTRPSSAPARWAAASR